MSLPSAVMAHLWPSSQSTRETEEPGNGRAAEEYTHLALAVKHYAQALVRNQAEAEDIAQECFVRLMQTRQRGVEVDRPLPWLLRVAHNLALDSLGRRPKEMPLDDSPASLASDPLPGPEQALMEKSRHTQVEQALARLSPQELRCWKLRAEGLRYREIGKILGVETGTVATFLVRAAEKLSAI